MSCRCSLLICAYLVMFLCITLFGHFLRRKLMLIFHPCSIISFVKSLLHFLLYSLRIMLSALPFPIGYDFQYSHTLLGCCLILIEFSIAVRSSWFFVYTRSTKYL